MRPRVPTLGIENRQILRRHNKAIFICKLGYVCSPVLQIIEAHVLLDKDYRQSQMLAIASLNLPESSSLLSVLEGFFPHQFFQQYLLRMPL